ncbi:DUF742 domain-containing protein [Streptomyces microflavus]|uniref:DUF742 domain-containing protein n=1 Tax=Streptomyces microflavus TaxID=1919 RepID=UPI0029A40B69|nr:DUF742 domain-containing protein [Streptomyces microflavus]MDX2406096.1 DUF742 domain-containing protein [Streptomyces microflavus]
MAAPTGGHPYEGEQRVPGEHGDNRFGYPAGSGGQAPGNAYQPYQQPQQSQGAHGSQGSEWPQQQPGSPWPQQQPQQSQRYDAHQQQRIQPVQQQRRAPEPAKPAAHNPLVRPYAMTGGRTRPRYQLAIEALVSTTADLSRLQGQLPEHQRICRLCIEIKSVAEVSALLSIPLGVARILVADLAEAGLVAIHQPGGDEAAGGQPDVTLLERVLSGLRKL